MHEARNKQNKTNNKQTPGAGSQGAKLPVNRRDAQGATSLPKSLCNSLPSALLGWDVQDGDSLLLGKGWDLSTGEPFLKSPVLRSCGGCVFSASWPGPWAPHFAPSPLPQAAS